VDEYRLPGSRFSGNSPAGRGQRIAAFNWKKHRKMDHLKKKREFRDLKVFFVHSLENLCAKVTLVCVFLLPNFHFNPQSGFDSTHPKKLVKLDHFPK